MDTFVQRFLFNLLEIQDCLVNMERVQLLKKRRYIKLFKVK